MFVSIMMSLSVTIIFSLRPLFSRSVREITMFFLEMPRFQIGLEPPIKPYGVGKFTYDSYLLFCCGQGRKSESPLALGLRQVAMRMGVFAHRGILSSRSRPRAS